MKNFVIYKSNGEIVRTGICQDDTLEMQAEDGELLLEATLTDQDTYVAGGALVAMPTRPDGEYEYDYDAKAWVFNAAQAAINIRIKRAELLKNGPDRVSPAWWAAMSAADQDAVTAYRQALLNITNQPSFPASVIWPDIPAIFAQ